MTRPPTAAEIMRRKIRYLTRGNLLIIAERALELLPATQLDALMGDFVRPEPTSSDNSIEADSVLDEVRRFYDAGISGQYYEAIDVHYKRSLEQSKGTDTFIAEFDRLLRKCLRAVEQEQPLVVREGFELLFELLRHIDEGHDDVIFFADDGGSLDVGVNWRIVFPAYFRCLAKTASAGEFALAVDRVIKDFVEYERPHHLVTARNVASAAQQIALDNLSNG
jgi:hypothetical protein